MTCSASSIIISDTLEVEFHKQHHMVPTRFLNLNLHGQEKYIEKTAKSHEFRSDTCNSKVMIIILTVEKKIVKKRKIHDSTDNR